MCDWCDSGIPTHMSVQVLIITEDDVDNTQHGRYCSPHCAADALAARVLLERVV